MVSIYDAGISFVYAYRDIETDILDIGHKSSNGEDKSKYITSCENPDFWERYSRGFMERYILFISDSEAKSKAAEWFSLDEGTKLGRKFFNAKNNAHKLDQSMLLTSEKQIIIDFLRGEGTGIEFGSADAIKAEKNKEIIRTIAEHIEKRTGFYRELEIPVSEVKSYDKFQVREELVNHNTVSRIHQRMLENPKLARETFLPIAVVVKRDGTKAVINGNTRLAAAIKTPGWTTTPVVFINETEFGSTVEIREKNYALLGLYMNREPFEIRVHNTKDDLKRNVNNFLYQENLDLSKPAHVDRARQLIYMNFDYACGSKQQLNGVLNSILSDFEKNQADLTYQDNLITYDDSYFSSYSWDKYRSKNISVVHKSVGDVANAKPLAYICRVMKKEKNKKGAIILHYTSKQELMSESKNKWIEDLKETIEYMNLPITVDILPAFKK